MFSISKRFDVTVQALSTANGLTGASVLKVGQKIGFDTREAGALPEITAIRKP